jgi:hypothetical protein
MRAVIKKKSDQIVKIRLEWSSLFCIKNLILSADCPFKQLVQEKVAEGTEPGEPLPGGQVCEGPLGYHGEVRGEGEAGKGNPPFKNVIKHFGPISVAEPELETPETGAASIYIPETRA